MKRTRLVSFLGLGRVQSEPPHYIPTRYSLNGRVSSVTPLADQAICELLGSVQSVVLLGTAKVKERWIPTNLIGKHLKHEHPLFRELPDGAQENERWEIFQTTADALSHEPIPDAREQQSPDEIVVNVTNGFRAQPLLGMAAISFVLSEWARKEIPHPPVLRVLYGAFDAKADPDSPAPIWDLTEFVAASRWNAALDALMRYGRADDLAQLAEIHGTARSKTERDLGQRFGAAAKSFADDLVLLRLRDLFTKSAPGLAHVLQSAEFDKLIDDLPPLAASIDALRRWVAPLSAPNVLGREGLRATAALAELYGRLQRFAEQAATIREGLVTHYAHLTGCEALPDPGEPGCYDRRSLIDKEWGKSHRGGTSQGAGKAHVLLVENKKLSQEVRRLRNDIEHCGLNNNPSSATELRKRLKTETESFSRVVEQHLK